MFGIGFGELLILIAVGIIILGPERCVDIAKALGKLWGKLQREWGDLKHDLSVDEDVRKLKEDLSAGKEVDEIKKDLSKIDNDYRDLKKKLANKDDDKQ